LGDNSKGAFMGEFSITHIVLFLIIALFLFGPSRLPGLGKSLGEAIKGFKKGLNDPPDQSVDPNHQISGNETKNSHANEQNAMHTKTEKDKV
jgi:TatA/E family protein of Tat protein translocase